MGFNPTLALPVWPPPSTPRGKVWRLDGRAKGQRLVEIRKILGRYLGKVQIQGKPRIGTGSVPREVNVGV